MVLAGLVLLVYFSNAPDRHRPITLVGMGLLMCLLVLSRRYYLFWAAGFFPAAAMAFLLGTPRVELTRHRVVLAGRNLPSLASLVLPSC